MEFKEYVRKTFPVVAVEVTLKNIEEVAEWCKGSIEEVPTKMMGTETLLPVIKIQGTGVNRGQEYIASLGSFVVELKGSFRSYKPAQFFGAFEEKAKPIELVAPSEDELNADPGSENYDGVTDAQQQYAKNSGYTMIPGDPTTFQKVI